MHLVKDELSSTRGNRDGTTIRTGTSVDTIDIRTITVDGRTFRGDDLNVKVWWSLVVWVWNDR